MWTFTAKTGIILCVGRQSHDLYVSKLVPITCKLSKATLTTGAHCQEVSMWTCYAFQNNKQASVLVLKLKEMHLKYNLWKSMWGMQQYSYFLDNQRSPLLSMKQTASFVLFQGDQAPARTKWGLTALFGISFSLNSHTLKIVRILFKWPIQVHSPYHLSALK